LLGLFVLETNAIEQGIGVVLEQDGHLWHTLAKPWALATKDCGHMKQN